MTIKETPNIITAVLKVTASAEFFDDDASEETVRYVIEQCLEDAGFEVEVELLKEQEPVEQKASEWLEDSDPGQEYGTTWACRKCRQSIHRPYIWNPYDSGYKYCPHCGAMMEVRLNA
jgi:rubrerythrin